MSSSLMEFFVGLFWAVVEKVLCVCVCVCVGGGLGLFHFL